MSDPFIGQIQTFGFNFAPRGWALCDGQLLAIASNTALFSLLGTIYGGDGRTSFGLPDLRGRYAMHSGNGPGLSNRRIGDKSGTEVETLTVNQIPSHNHTVGVQSGQGNQRSPVGNVLAAEPANVTAPYSNQAPNGALAPAAIGNTGGTQPHNNMPPYLVINFSIALTGIFPSRN